MKKNVIAILLAVVMASGSIGSVPVLAAEATAQESEQVQEETRVAAEQEEADEQEIVEEPSERETAQEEDTITGGSEKDTFSDEQFSEKVYEPSDKAEENTDTEVLEENSSQEGQAVEHIEYEQEIVSEETRDENVTAAATAHLDTISLRTDDQSMVPGDTDGQTAEDLFSSYVDNAFSSQQPAEKLRAKKRTGARLTGTNAAIYTSIANELPAIAVGERASTVFEISVDDLGLEQTSWTAEDLGVEAIVIEDENGDGNIAKDAAAVVEEKTAYDLSLIVNSLLADFPYQLYWYEKSQNTSGTGFYLEAFYDEESSVYKLAVTGSITISMPVSNDFAAGDYTVDTSIGRSVQTSVANAQAIVEEFSIYTDLEKLTGYRERICSLVSYNDEAAGGSVNYGNPWQMIWVFDGDDTTNVVCEGYAKAFKYLCDQSTFSGDISCSTVTGTMSGGTGAGPHMWNIVNMEDGNNYLVDVTNCDEGTVGSPDKLFLCGLVGQEDLTKPFGIQLQADEITYIYDQDTLNIQDESDLFLSDVSYFLRIGKIVEVEGIKYRIFNNQAKVIGCAESVNNVSIANVIEGVPVVSIDNEAFSECESIESVLIPDSVSEIQERAFFNCINLETVSFDNNSALSYLGPYCFSNCTKIREINLPPSLRRIDEGAFSDCSGIEELYLPEGLVYIGQGALSASGISTLYLPASLIEFGNFFASRCDNLQHIIVAEGNPVLKVIDDALYLYGESISFTIGSSDEPTYNEGWTLFLYPLGKESSEFTLWENSIGISDSSDLGNNKYIQTLNTLVPCIFALLQPESLCIIFTARSSFILGRSSSMSRHWSSFSAQLKLRKNSTLTSERTKLLSIRSLSK